MADGINWEYAMGLTKEDIPEDFWKDVAVVINAYKDKIPLLKYPDWQLKQEERPAIPLKEASEAIDKEKGIICFSGYEFYSSETKVARGFYFECLGKTKERWDFDVFMGYNCSHCDDVAMCILMLAERYYVIRPRPWCDYDSNMPWAYDSMCMDDLEVRRAEGMMRELGFLGKFEKWDSWRKSQVGEEYYHELFRKKPKILNR